MQHDLVHRRSCCTGAAGAATALGCRFQLPGGYGRHLERVDDAWPRSLLLPKAAGGCLTERERERGESGRTRLASLSPPCLPPSSRGSLKKQSTDTISLFGRHHTVGQEPHPA